MPDSNIKLRPRSRVRAFVLMNPVGGTMRVRAMVLALAAVLAVSTLASAQQQTGDIIGKVTDTSGAVLPGVSVTLSAPHLLQPMTAVTSDSGTYQFPRLPIGTYEVKFE